MKTSRSRWIWSGPSYHLVRLRRLAVTAAAAVSQAKLGMQADAQQTRRGERGGASRSAGWSVTSAGSSVVGTGLAALRAALWVVEMWERGQEVPAETRTLEIRAARGVEPPVDARKVKAAAIHRTITVDAGHPISRPSLVTIGTANAGPVGRKRVAAARAAASTQTDHVDGSVRHPRYTERPFRRHKGG